ncbi:GlsB/YeaQ/YmgE family stress response membrane protein [Nocardia sp. CA2R105]|uniref:GlsB/YeaQ/YmgE family stress response membrane protein n=1 Tax=Nocardia coffeae TaxID=2873381 RepID=UPI001CA62625|nr:GlsB/YeaQ/YmgE family stress response membrane protein [Nocardia coffeae]MBY8862101.1 GlsB/YeaQ/YmgE family stress response membrane protein [Nocardia coffeae]
MGIITMIIIGLIAGAIARLLIPGRQRIGWLATIVVGIVGSYVGGTLGSLVFAPHIFSVHPPVHHLFLGSIVGAVIVLLIFNTVRSRV